MCGLTKGDKVHGPHATETEVLPKAYPRRLENGGSGNLIDRWERSVGGDASR
jgi:hypothetical protein